MSKKTAVYYEHLTKVFHQIESLIRKPHRHCVKIGYGTFVNGPYCFLNHDKVSFTIFTIIFVQNLK